VYVAQVNAPGTSRLVYGAVVDIDTFRDAPILAYDDLAATEFERLRQARIRIGTKDLRIAAICISNGATLLTRNLKDFGQVPGLRAEDWSV